MILYFADDSYDIPELSKSIFLAGPSPRGGDNVYIKETWRHEAVRHLKENNYDGYVFIPMTHAQFEQGDFTGAYDYDGQIAWEDKWLSAVDSILCWIPRTKELMGLTTNIEVGRYLESFRLYYGRPEGALNTRYIDEQFKKRGLTYQESLESLVAEVVSALGTGVVRTGINVTVPQILYNMSSYKEWYQSLCNNGNVLKSVKVTNVVGNSSKRKAFIISFHSSIFVTDENRLKNNEESVVRGDLTVIVPYYIDSDNIPNFIMVDEFRQAVTNEIGTVLEFPSGGLEPNISPEENAIKELHEETGIKIDGDRLEYVGCHQAYATMLVFKVYIYKVKFNDVEFKCVMDSISKGTVLGENPDERIGLHIVDPIDFSKNQPNVDMLTMASYLIVKNTL